MAEKKGAAVSKTARRSMIDDKKRVESRAIAWAWERGFKTGVGRKPDAHLFNEEEIKRYDPEDFIIIRANSAWNGSSNASTGQRR